MRSQVPFASVPSVGSRILGRLFPLLLLCTPLIWAQLYTGTVTGVVSDPSGASIPLAKITLVDLDKGFTFTTTADSEGHYFSPTIPPGAYKITVGASGFADGVRPNVRLDVNQHLTVDFTLTVGATNTTVEVHAETPLLSAQDAVTGQVIDSRDLVDLPGHSVMALVNLAPGVTEASLACASCQLNNFFSAGSRNATTDVLFDGVTTTVQSMNVGGLNSKYAPSSDAVEQFVVQESNFSAEYGFTGSTIINMITKSGTNQFHGVLFEYLRNDIFDAQNWFANRTGAPVTKLRNNDFGGTIGGPIKKDKIFFFGDFEGSRNAGVFNSGIVPTPTATEKTGNFADLCSNVGGTFDAAGLCSTSKYGIGQLWDPYSSVYSSSIGGAVRTQYIPFNNLNTYKGGALIDPVGFKMAQYYPAPNVAVGAHPGYVAMNYLADVGSYQNDNKYDIKVDDRLSDKTLLGVKYTEHDYTHPALHCFDNIADPCNQGDQKLGDHLVAVNYTQSFTPTIVATISYGFSRTTYVQAGIGGESQYKTATPSSVLGMPSYMSYNGVGGVPSINSDGVLPLGENSDFTRQGSQVHQLQGSVTWARGHHVLKFGAEGRLYQQSSVQTSAALGYFQSNLVDGATSQVTTGGPSLGNPVAGLMTGISSSGSFGIPNYDSTRNFNVGGFIQDNWSVNRNLTLNLGLRYEVWMPETERYNRMNELDPNVVSPLQVPGLGTLHGGMIFMGPGNPTNYNLQGLDFGPRVGFAYRLGNSTVVRGGYGIYYSTSMNGAAGSLSNGFSMWSSTTPLMTTYQSNGYTPAGQLSNPFPNGLIYPPGNTLGLLSQVGFGANGPIPALDSASPYEQTWTLGIQRTLPLNFLVEANYLGKKGTHLYFGGSGALNLLPQAAEGYSAAQLQALNTYVANPFYGIITNPISSLSVPTIPQAQLAMPYPQFTNFAGSPLPVADSSYNALQLRAQKRLSNGLQLLVNYSYSKSLDDASNAAGNMAWLGAPISLQDPYKRFLERGLSSFDIPQSFTADFSYELPVGRGKTFGSHMNKWFDAVVGGWQANGIITMASGAPLSFSLAGARALPGYSQRPNLSGPLECTSGSETAFVANYFANAASVLSAPAPYALGTAPRNIGSCRAPGPRNADLSVLKNFALPWTREGTKLQFRMEAYNALNRPMFGTPNTQVNGGTFGQITGQANSPRQLQAAIKLYW